MLKRERPSPTIEIEEIAANEFNVRVTEGSAAPTHRVTVRPEYLHRLAGGKIEAQELVRRSFEFLLEREPKESILPQFDLQVIARYFPEYERELKSRLAGS